MHERKTLSVELKAEDEEGRFRATFATFGVVDLDGDVTRPGAFATGQEVRLAQWGHNWGALPVGKGVIDADNERAWVDGQFNLKTNAGRDTYETVKDLGALQEWSYGFEVTKASYGQFEGREVRFLEGLKVFEVSPVMLGAGINTGTDFVKSSFDQESERVLLLMREFVDRAKARAAMRGKEGRILSAANRERLARHLDTLAEIRSDIEQLLADTEPKAAVNPMEEFIRFEQLRARLNGVAV